MTKSYDTSPFVRRMSASGLLASLVVALSALFTVLVLVPLVPKFPDSSLDSSWMYAFNIAVGQGLQLGRDLVFTFGPLAAVYTGQYFPATDATMLAVSLLLAAAVFLNFRLLLGESKRWLLLSLPLVFSQAMSRDVLLIGLPLLVLFASGRSSAEKSLHRVCMAVGMAAVAVLPIIKGSTIPTVFFCAVATTWMIWKQSRSLACWTVALFFASISLGWLVTGQDIRNLPHFFVAQGPIISGYTDAMSIDGKWTDIAVYLGCGTLLACSLWMMKDAQRRLLAVASALFVFLCFKAGFVRHDDHTSVAAFALLFLGYLGLVFEPSWRSGAMLLIAVFGWVCVLPDARKPDPVFMARNVAISVGGSWKGILMRARGGDEMESKLAMAKQKIREAFPLPDTHGTTADLYPTDLSVLFANSGRWSPRPVLQSYSAYTPKLAKLNADHLQGAGADRVFFSIAPIDAHYPALDDGLSWLSLLGQYAPSGFASGYLVLDRVAFGRAINPGPVLSEARPLLGDLIDVPKSDLPVFVKIDVRPSFIGRLIGLMFKPPQLHIVVEFSAGEKRSFRYIAGMGQTGFVLSPTISTAAEFALLRTSKWKTYLGDKVPVRVGIFGDDGSRLAWQPSYDVKFFGIDVAPDANAETLVFPAPVNLAALAGLPKASDCNFDLINESPVGGRPVKVAGPLVRVSGWAAISAEKGIPNEKISVAVVSKDGGAALFLLPVKQERPDVARAFSQRNLKMAGFSGVVNTLQVDLPAEFRLVQHLGAELYVCDKSVWIERP
jgi:hypothetical protein